jgi:hypothetical protein
VRIGSPRKKLAGAALHWLGVDRPKARPLTVDDDVADGLRRLGVSEEQIEEALEVARADELEAQGYDYQVHEDCWQSVLLFLRVGTQWDWLQKAKPAGMGVVMWSERAGLNYSRVESALRMGGVERSEWAGLFEDLRAMEVAVLEAEAAQR